MHIRDDCIYFTKMRRRIDHQVGRSPILPCYHDSLRFSSVAYEENTSGGSSCLWPILLWTHDTVHVEGISDLARAYADVQHCILQRQRFVGRDLYNNERLSRLILFCCTSPFTPGIAGHQALSNLAAPSSRILRILSSLLPNGRKHLLPLQ
jgi:hypothetical protein